MNKSHVIIEITASESEKLVTNPSKFFAKRTLCIVEDKPITHMSTILTQNNTSKIMFTKKYLLFGYVVLN